MSVEDLKIKCEIRNILVQFWIDTTKLNISSHRGVVYLRGSLERIRKEYSMSSQDRAMFEKDTLRILQNLEERIRRIRNVKRIIFDLDNFRKVGQIWQKTK